MEAGKVEHAPDYKSEPLKITILDEAQSAILRESLNRAEAEAIRARLERLVIEAAKALRVAVKEIAEVEPKSYADGFRQIARLGSVHDQMLAKLNTTVDALIDFESQIKK